ncbi:MAG: HAD-IC family P-type ATPase [Oscillospiraceae bacterium]|nr:HAD-IC family P-type ATPase [Oscillospiraceae bacterium]
MNTERFSPAPDQGLSARQVAERQRQNLTNVTEDNITKSYGRILRENICTLFNLFNLLIGIALFAVKAYSNMAYLLVILLNILIGIVQEVKAKRLVEKLSVVSQLKADVVRDGQQIALPVEQLVLDDVVCLELGKQVCADAIIVQGQLEVNESLLTGEADPIVKGPGELLLSGSFVVSGNCRAKVEHVGAKNYAAGLVQKAKQYRPIESQLRNSMRRVTRFTSFFIVPIGVFLFIEAFFLRFDPTKMAVISSSAALLGMLPKGLMLLISIALATGVIRLSRKRILVQQPHSIETIARVDVLCLDKTGTLTTGEMKVSGFYKLNPSGALNAPPSGASPASLPVENLLTAFVHGIGDRNATLNALKAYFPEESAQSSSVQSISASGTPSVSASVPFSSERKWSAVTFTDGTSYVLGAPEKLAAGAPLLTEMQNEAKQGNRLLCFGRAASAPAANNLPPIQLLAVIVLTDPLRENAKETLAFFRDEGVQVKVISGDNPVTVSNIARRAGLAAYDKVIDMSAVPPDADFRALARQYSVFGRVTPQQKSALVKGLQADGHKVAMTGDGVNDILALREADCSIAMNEGSEAARQVAHFVLLHSDFTALPDAVMEGRRVINNLTRVASVFFVKTLYSVIVSVICILAMIPFPFIPLQITLIDLVIEGYPSLFMSFEANKKRVKGRFLPTVLHGALPFALLVVTGIFAIELLTKAGVVASAMTTTLQYYFTGFVGVLAVLKACLPFNKLRLFLFVTVAVGFFAAIWLFTNVVQVPRPDSLQTVGILMLCAFIALPLKWLYGKLANALFRRRVEV